MTTVAPTTGEV